MSTPLSEIARDIKMCRSCPLSGTRTNAVPGAGSPRAGIVFIGDLPGDYEDREGSPFLGKAGGRLNEWLTLVGLERDHLFLTNVLKCRTEDHRFPKDVGPNSPASKCLPHLYEQLRAINPLAIILAGEHAAQAVLFNGTGEVVHPLDRWVGEIARRRDLYGETRIGIVYHPAHVARTRNAREEQRCLTTLRRIKNYVQAKVADRPAPLDDIVEIRPVGAQSVQQRLRLFGAAPLDESQPKPSTAG